MSATLHYIYDPLCGWCYGAEALVRAADELPDIEIELHAGGLWPQPTRLPEETRRYIQQADARIASLSGQTFGTAYLEGLLLDPSLVLDSRPTTAAVLAAEAIDPGSALTMLRCIQHAHYREGRHVVETKVLIEIAEQRGLERSAFCAAVETAPVDRHIAETRRLMARLGASGFPAFALQIDKDWLPVPHHQFANKGADFGAWLTAAST